MQLKFNYPENYSPRHKNIFYFIDIPEELPNAEVVETTGWWNVAASKVLRFPNNIFEIFASFFGFRKKIIKLESATWVTDNYSSNYFHWMNDVLPRLMLLREREINCTVMLMDNVAKQSFVKDTLQSLSWKYEVVNLNSICKVGKLYLPKMTAAEGSQHPVYFSKVCKSLAGQDIIPYRKVFISRAGSPYRNIIPNNEFEQLIKSYGFEIVMPDKMSIGEQINLFKECTHLIAVHGAGLTNMAFMPHGKSKVLEIRRSDDKLNYCYFKMANVLNHKYYYFLAEAEDISKPIQLDNVLVDINSFEKTLLDFLRKK